jgi:hypothetical protein
MEGKNSVETSDDKMRYSLRLTVGILHGALLTLLSFLIVLLVPFALFGFVLVPLLSVLLTVFCNLFIEYISGKSITLKSTLQGSWIPAFGIFCVSCVVYPLKFMPSLPGPVSALVATSMILNCVVAAMLQIYVTRRNQSSSSELPVAAAGGSGPI